MTVAASPRTRAAIRFLHPVPVGPREPAREILRKLQAGGNPHFTAGTYDLTTLPNNIVLANSLRITGDGSDRVTINIAPAAGVGPGIGDDLFLFRGSEFYMSGVKWVGERVAVAMTGLTTRVERFEVEDCAFEDTSAGIKLDTTSASAGTELGVVRFNRNVCRNVNSGVALRLGNGSASAAHDIPIDYFEAFDNDLETLDKYGIVCNYDDTDAAYEYANPASFAHVARNRIVDLQGRAGSSVTGFGINCTACRRVLVEGNYLEAVIKGDRVNIEAIYNKAPDFSAIGNMIVDCDGDQGAIAAKGEDAGAVVNIIANTIIARSMAMLNGIWGQSLNANIVGNDIRGRFTNSPIKTGGSAAADNLRIEGNELVSDGSSGEGSHGIRVDISAAHLVVKGNRIRRIADSDGSWRGILVTLGDGEAVEDPIFVDNIIAREGAGTETLIGIELAPHASGPITDPQILRNHALNLDTFVSLITAACTGTVLIQGNSEVGVTTDVNNAAASTVDAQFNSWD